MKFIVGTAQLSNLKYGITNKTDIDENEINKMLLYCKSNNIDHFDTARCYDSEKYLKNIDGTIITKLPSMQNDNIEEINKYIDLSLKDLNKTQIDILLLHNIDNYHNKNIWNYLLTLKNTKIRKLGLSVYEYDDIKDIIYDKNIECIQIPFNILSFNEWKNIQRDNLLIYVRSIYLQGLLIGTKEDWNKINMDDKYINILDEFVDKYKFKSKKELCLSYVKSNNWIDGIIIGVDNYEQLKENYELFNNIKIFENINEINLELNERFNNISKYILDPRKWKK